VAPFGGRIVDLHVDVGDVVLAGQPIAVIDDRELAEDGEVLDASLAAARAEAKLASAERRAASANLRDVGRLVRRGVASRQELTQARLRTQESVAASAVARARVDELVARRGATARRTSEAVVLAPWTSWVATRQTAVGATVAEGAPLVRIVSTQTVVAFAIDPERLATDAETIFRIETSGGELIADAQDISIAPEVDPGSGMRFASARVEALGHVLIPGQVVQVRPVQERSIAREAR
jgi:multidrug efflux pump subunit AcrA (membrane-fusion protein)